MSPVEDHPKARHHNRVQPRVRRTNWSNDGRINRLLKTYVGLNHQARALVFRKSAEEAIFEDWEIDLKRPESDHRNASGLHTRGRNNQWMVTAIAIDAYADLAPEYDLEASDAGGDVTLPGNQAPIGRLYRHLLQTAFALSGVASLRGGLRDLCIGGGRNHSSGCG
jgi:hypothetical protein